MSPHDGVPLLGLPGWTRPIAEKLAGRWITTAEQVVGIAATPDGIESLAAELNVTPHEMRELVARARDALPSDTAERLGRPADTRDRGRGASRPDE